MFAFCGVDLEYPDCVISGPDILNKEWGFTIDPISFWGSGDRNIDVFNTARNHIIKFIIF
jgi:hypothetical protein